MLKNDNIFIYNNKVILIKIYIDIIDNNIYNHYYDLDIIKFINK